MASAAVDNDVLIKLAAYRLLADGAEALGGLRNVGVLGAARYVIPSAISRDARILDQAGAIAAWRAIEDDVETLEPSREELEFAALIEEFASRSSLPMDSGESQLFAMALSGLHRREHEADKQQGEMSNDN